MSSCVKGHPEFNEESCCAFVCDLTRHPLSAFIARAVDMASLFFVLSAITPEKMVQVLKNVFGVSIVLSRIVAGSKIEACLNTQPDFELDLC